METVDPGPKPEDIISVSTLTKRIKDVIENEPELNDVWVKGEISNFTHHSSGHMYFSLKDRGAQIRAVMFRRYASILRQPPESGQEVVAYGRIGIYEQRGEYQLYVTYMQPAGMGSLYLEFEKLKKKLMEEGLFDENLKKPIPSFPRRIAVVTSPTGAAVRDVINIITRRYPAVEVTVVPATVQGDSAPASLIKAMTRAEKLERVDTILLVRGGGSIEDLWGFNDEGVARKVAACDIPVISGVGHETDFTIADFVADLRAPTPSAAAEICVPDLYEIKRGIDSADFRMNRRMTEMIRYFRTRLQTASATLSIPRLLENIDRRRQMLDDARDDGLYSIENRISTHSDKITAMENQLNALDPRKVMQRGYSIVADSTTGKVISSAKDIKHGRLLDLQFGDGTVPARADLKVNTQQGALDFE